MLSDTLIVNYLLQNIGDGNILWNRDERGFYTAGLNKKTKNQVNIKAYVANGRATSQICLEFTSLRFEQTGKFSKAYIIEPLPRLFSKRYDAEENGILADLLKKLYQSARKQCADRELKGMDDEEEIKQEIFSQVLNFDNRD